MARVKYCPLCQRAVEPVKKWSWGWFLLGVILFGVGAIVYVLYYLMFAPKKYCPICGTKRLQDTDTAAEQKERGKTD